VSIFGHSHDYQAIAVENREHHPVMLAATTSTVILWHCPCRVVCSQEVEGNWTLGQIRGERELTQRERIEADLPVAAAQTSDGES
jgi:hypothetical protein